MSALVIALIVIILSYLYPSVINFLSISKSLTIFTIAYGVVVLLGAGIATYLGKAGYSTGDILVIPIAMVGFVVRVGVYYFRKSGTLPVANQ